MNSFLTFLTFLSLCSLLLLLIAVHPFALVDDLFGAVTAAAAQHAISVGQIVLPYAFVFGPVEHALDVLRVVGAEDGNRAAPDACTRTSAKPVKESLVETAVAHFRAFGVRPAYR